MRARKDELGNEDDQQKLRWQSKWQTLLKYYFKLNYDQQGKDLAYYKQSMDPWLLHEYGLDVLLSNM